MNVVYPNRTAKHKLEPISKEQSRDNSKAKNEQFNREIF